jgi:hypothetical protein
VDTQVVLALVQIDNLVQLCVTVNEHRHHCSIRAKSVTESRYVSQWTSPGRIDNRHDEVVTPGSV